MLLQILAAAPAEFAVYGMALESRLSSRVAFRALWLVYLVCDLVQSRTGQGRTTTRLHMRLRPGPGRHPTRPRMMHRTRITVRQAPDCVAAGEEVTCRKINGGPAS